MSRLDEIKARCDAATEGPWSAKGGFTSDPMIEVYGQTVFINPDLDGDPIQPEVWADVEFISAAREDVPWLLTLVESLTAERDALAAKVARVESLAEEWDRMGGFTPNVDLGTFLTPGVNRDALRLFVYRCSPTTASLRPRTSAQAVAGARCIRAALAEPTGPDDLVRCDCGRAVPCRHCEPTGQEGDQ